jgi:hypothetical protein
MVDERSRLINEFKLKLPVTGAQLMSLSHYGLMTNDNSSYANSCFKLYKNPDDFKVLLATLFEGEWSQVKFQDINIERFQEALRDFLSRSLGGSRRSGEQATV